MCDQDWNVVVLHTKKQSKQQMNISTKNTQTVKKNPDKVNARQISSNKIRLVESQCDNDTFKTKKVDHQTKMTIQQARQSKNLTQSQLATMCNLCVSVIRDYENGTITPTTGELKKISSILKVNL